MKTKVIIAVAAAVLSGIAVYFYTRRKPVQKQIVNEKERHHLTNAFSRAKEHATSHTNN